MVWIVKSGWACLSVAAISHDAGGVQVSTPSDTRTIVASSAAGN